MVQEQISPDEGVADEPAAVDQVRRRLLLGAAAFLVALVVGYIVLVVTSWGHNLNNEAYFGRDIDGRAVVDAEGDLLGHVTVAVLAISLIMLLLVGVVQRATIVGLIAVTGICVAVMGAEVLKRTLPWEHLIATDYALPHRLQEETYPSGHTTIGTSFALALLLLIPHTWRWWAAIVAGFIAATFGFGVVFAGWHRPADAIGGYLWSALVMSIAAWLAVRFRGSGAHSEGFASESTGRRRTSVLGSAALGLALFVVVIAAAFFGGQGLPDADVAFVVSASVIATVGVLVPSWYGNTLAGIRWTPTNDVAPARR